MEFSAASQSSIADPAEHREDFSSAHREHQDNFPAALGPSIRLALQLVASPDLEALEGRVDAQDSGLVQDSAALGRVALAGLDPVQAQSLRQEKLPVQRARHKAADAAVRNRSIRRPRKAR